MTTTIPSPTGRGSSWPAAAALACLLGAAGCATPGVGGAVVDAHADVDTRMCAVAERFDRAYRRGGMTGVMLDVEGCYADATRPVARVFALRDCLV